MGAHVPAIRQERRRTECEYREYSNYHYGKDQQDDSVGVAFDLPRISTLLVRLMPLDKMMKVHPGSLE